MVGRVVGLVVVGVTVLVAADSLGWVGCSPAIAGSDQPASRSLGLRRGMGWRHQLHSHRSDGLLLATVIDLGAGRLLGYATAEHMRTEVTAERQLRRPG